VVVDEHVEGAAAAQLEHQAPVTTILHGGEARRATTAA
jgi:hypothetical protein